MITFDEVLKEIERLDQEQPEGFTKRELMEATGRSKEWCEDKIRQLIKSGSLKYNGKRHTLDITGRPCYLPVYNLQ